MSKCYLAALDSEDSSIFSILLPTQDTEILDQIPAFLLSDPKGGIKMASEIISFQRACYEPAPLCYTMQR